MATQMFFRDATASVHRGTNSAPFDGGTTGWLTKLLQTTRGGSLATLTTNTIAGATSGREVTNGAGSADKIEWISEPVSADVTISGTITANIWVAESSMNANVAINVAIYRMAAITGALTLIVKSTRTTEEAVTTRAAANFTTGMTSGAYTGVALSRGDRILIRIFGDDAGTMGSGFTFVIGYNGATGAADGDSFVTFTETFGFEGTPSTQDIYLTDTASSVDNGVLDTGWLTPGTVTNVDRGGGNAWSGTGNLGAEDATYATAITDTVGTDYLRCQNWGVSLPVGSIVRGVQIEIVGHTNNGARDMSFHQVSSTGGFAGEDTGPGTITTGADQTKSHAGQDYYWGAIVEDGLAGTIITMTRSELQDVDWGFDVWCPNTTADTISLDTVRVKVFYSTIYRTLEMWTSRGASSHSGGHTAIPNGWDAVGGMCGAEDPTVPFTSRRGGGVQWVTKPLQAFTLGGMLRLNIRAKESGARTGLRAEMYIVSQDGQTWTKWAQGICNINTNSAGELPTSETALLVQLAGDDTAVTDGQRLGLRIFAEDTSNAAASALPSLTFTYSGPTGGAAGDSFVSLNATLLELVSSLVLQQGFVNFNDPGVL